MRTKLIAIIPAAGIGARAQEAPPSGSGQGEAAPKQYRLLKGEPMLRWAVRAMLADERITQVRVAVAADDVWAEAALAGLSRTVWRPCGGPSRAETVLAALRDAALDPADWVLVHDAARPGLPAQALKRLIDCCLRLQAGGLLAQPVADTVKLAVDEDRGDRPGQGDGHVEQGGAASRVVRSVDRQGLWLAQTPQMFPAGRLQDALQGAGASSTALTDEASAMELAGYSPCLIPGSARNFKVTWPEDFGLMEKWL
jgi:2-C-methyl-D-erythritol 4-phosphate cytidylyltransferase